MLSKSAITLEEIADEPEAMLLFKIEKSDETPANISDVEPVALAFIVSKYVDTFDERSFMFVLTVSLVSADLPEI